MFGNEIANRTALVCQIRLCGTLDISTSDRRYLVHEYCKEGPVAQRDGLVQVRRDGIRAVPAERRGRPDHLLGTQELFISDTLSAYPFVFLKNYLFHLFMFGTRRQIRIGL